MQDSPRPPGRGRGAGLHARGGGQDGAASVTWLPVAGPHGLAPMRSIKDDLLMPCAVQN
jgi:hypothetical protein